MLESHTSYLLTRTTFFRIGLIPSDTDIVVAHIVELGR